jgi:hypothetical protein
MRTLLFLFVLSAMLTACSSPVNLEKEKEMLLAIHKKGREKHFNLDAEAMGDGAVDSLITVYGGNVTRVTKEQVVSRFKRSFEGAEYSKWDDLEEPVVRISDDATLAWVIVRLEVQRTKRDSTGKTNPEAFIYAGITAYKKVNSDWTREANVSTFTEL